MYLFFSYSSVLSRNGLHRNIPSLLQPEIKIRRRPIAFKADTGLQDSKARSRNNDHSPLRDRKRYLISNRNDVIP
jgi:hypothetical protein